MAGRSDDTLAIMAAVLLIFAAMLNPSGMIAIVLLLAFQILLTRRPV